MIHPSERKRLHNRTTKNFRKCHEAAGTENTDRSCDDLYRSGGLDILVFNPLHASYEISRLKALTRIDRIYSVFLDHTSDYCTMEFMYFHRDIRKEESLTDSMEQSPS
jgi:hypothetical protein